MNMLPRVIECIRMHKREADCIESEGGHLNNVFLKLKMLFVTIKYYISLK